MANVKYNIHRITLSVTNQWLETHLVGGKETKTRTGKVNNISNKNSKC